MSLADITEDAVLQAIAEFYRRGRKPFLDGYGFAPAGPIFRRVNWHCHVLGDRLSGEAVALVIRERLSAAGFDPAGYSGHSLRAGFATSAAKAGVSSWKIRAQTGHASDAMLARYIRDGEMFSDNAAGALL
jgi:integrase